MMATESTAGYGKNRHLKKSLVIPAEAGIQPETIYQTNQKGR